MWWGDRRTWCEISYHNKTTTTIVTALITAIQLIPLMLSSFQCSIAIIFTLQVVTSRHLDVTNNNTTHCKEYKQANVIFVKTLIQFRDSFKYISHLTFATIVKSFYFYLKKVKDDTREHCIILSELNIIVKLIWHVNSLSIRLD